MALTREDLDNIEILIKKVMIPEADETEEERSNPSPTQRQERIDQFKDSIASDMRTS